MEKEIKEKQAKRLLEVCDWPVAATVQTCVILDVTGGIMFSGIQGADMPEGDLARRAWAVLSTIIETRFSRDELKWQSGLYDAGPFLFGPSINTQLRIMTLDAFRGDDSGPIPVGAWYSPTFEPYPWADPFDIIVPADRRNDIDLAGLCRFLEIQPLALADTAATEAWAQAEIARQLVLKCQLIPHAYRFNTTK